MRKKKKKNKQHRKKKITFQKLKPETEAFVTKSDSSAGLGQDPIFQHVGSVGARTPPDIELKLNFNLHDHSATMSVLRCYWRPGNDKGRRLASILQRLVVEHNWITATDCELCFTVLWRGITDPTKDEMHRLAWLVKPHFTEHAVSWEPGLNAGPSDLLFEVGPRLNFSTPWSTNAVAICQAIGLLNVARIECSERYLIKVDGKSLPGPEMVSQLVPKLYDRMTQSIYQEPLTSFELDIKAVPTFDVDVLGRGRAALEEANRELGLAFDDWDLDYYTRMFCDEVGRNPTSVECFDLAQSNSEHSRHWFFKGRLHVEGRVEEQSLFQMVMSTQERSNANSIIKFNDNSSAIRGGEISCLYPKDPALPSPFSERPSLRHAIFTAETHNFPTGVAPFSGATTGAGGRIRDVQCTGRGAHVIAGTAGYTFGNLHIPGYPLPWEDDSVFYPSNFARPLEVAIEASNGASDYGNKFGEPVLAAETARSVSSNVRLQHENITSALLPPQPGGFARSFGQLLPSGERSEWVKPIMFSGGLGSLDGRHVNKMQPEKGMLVVKIGGPAYRIGVGGGAASSIQVQGDNETELDFGAVQRGDAEMEQKMNRALRACLESPQENPICSLHDQGAGGNGNVLKELCEPEGAVMYTSRFQTGDPTLSVLELWGAEYQESNALLMKHEDLHRLRTFCQRERCPIDVVGDITGDGRIVLIDDREKAAVAVEAESQEQSITPQHPVDLKLDWVLGRMPPKDIFLTVQEPVLRSLVLPAGLTVHEALGRVLRLPSVASKRYLTNKVDRSVSGLVAQQQCVGPLHTPLADVAVVAFSPLSQLGIATAIGEQPLKGLVRPEAGGRMALAEALTNLVFARVTDLKDVKCSANWMWPAKLPGEGACLLRACRALCDTMKVLGVAIDGGKDSLSMAARVGDSIVKAPGELVISAYAICPDITATITSDLKHPDGKGVLVHVPVHTGSARLGGSALAQCFGQLGDDCPDLDCPESLSACFLTTQELITDGLLSAGHDISDGGLISCVLEMAFAGNYGVDVNVEQCDGHSVLEILFSEELGLILEVRSKDEAEVLRRYSNAGLQCTPLGRVTAEGPGATVCVSVGGTYVLEESLSDLRDIWEETSFRLERLQVTEACTLEEERGLAKRRAPPFKLTFEPVETPPAFLSPGPGQPIVATIREEGSNGDREMVAALHMAGFEVWDITMQDLLAGVVTLDRFRGIVFVGGFSYADVFGSAKGWAASVMFDLSVRAQFSAFHSRTDTFSLGVCNGCQLMALLGWVAQDLGDLGCAGNSADEMHNGVVLTHNLSGRFESRFVTVKVLPSPALMLVGMEGSALGIWVAHGEGHMKFKKKQIIDTVLKQDLAPLRYVDDDGIPTECYPLNPNGSPLGIAALCSGDGRHLAMMPHPERCVLTWQWPWMPYAWRTSLTTSPWLQMFQNAHTWCRREGSV
uniref:Phosphoribosylformylglycinamidine synthase n=1 Tax=Eptatretus burgeri TaxID=7764 RepID=A0A8C4QRP9_EPTBU